MTLFLLTYNKHMNQYKNLAKNFLIYSSGAIVLRLVTALSVLITIKIVEPAQFGLLALLSNITIFLPILLGLGLRQVLGIEFFSKKNCWTLVWQLLMIYLVFAIPAAILLLLNLNYLNMAIFAGQANTYLLLITILISFINFLPELLFQLLRFQNKAFLLTSIQICMGIIIATIGIVLVYVFKVGIIGILIAQLIAQSTAGLFFGYLLYQNKNWFRIPQKQTIIKYLKIGLPFVPNIIFAWLIIASNRWLLSWHLDLKDVGIYSLAENLSLMFQTLITQPLAHTYLPFALKRFANNQSQIIKIDQEYNTLAYLFIGVFCVLIPIGFIIIKPVLQILLPTKYLSALPLLTPLLIAQVIFTATHITSASIQYIKKTYILAIFMSSSAIIGVLINLYLMPKYGIYSCIVATNAAYLFYFVSILFIKNYQFKSFS
jgi:O-antigen/teichoic acid export membrane protein